MNAFLHNRSAYKEGIRRAEAVEAANVAREEQTQAGFLVSNFNTDLV